jgi:plastocyanin
MRTSRTLLVSISFVALLGWACSDDDSGQASASTTTASTTLTGPQNYTVVVDGPSTLGAENFVLGTYFPKTLAVGPGDTVTFDNRSSNDIHTVTFGVKSDRSDQPAVVTKAGQENPAVFKPCFRTDPVKPQMTSCPPPTAGTPEFDGKGFWNSGVILPTALPAEAGPKTVVVKLASDIAPGSYVVTCLLHPPMESTLQVVGSDTERQTPAQVAAAADRELGQAKAAAAQLPAPESVATAAGPTVTASWGDKTAVVNRFHPETVSIKVGQTITWRSATTWMPHTVSFQPPFASPSEPDALLPAGAKSGAKFAGGVSHSGIFGPPPFYAPETFSLTFTKAGQYPYLCLLHPGMTGTVQVT